MRGSRVWRALLLAAGAWVAGERLDGQIAGREAQAKIVELSVVALDAKGQPVGDLKADEVQIADAGKPQKVAVFRHSDAQLQQALPLAAGEFSNRGAANVPHATLILFDLLNESFDARGTAMNYLQQGLRSLESSDNLYFYVLTVDTRLYPVIGLPGSENPAPSLGGAPWTKDAKAIVEGAMAKVYGLRSVNMDIDTRVRATYRALESVANLLAGIPGRKNIVWITHGIPIELGPAITGGLPVDYTPMLRRMSDVLSRVNVAIYPVMQVPPGMAMQGPDAQYSGLGSEDTLQSFADLTGGPAKSTNAIGTVIRQALNDVRTSYQIGYYPPVEAWDGKFHKLRVTCTRKGVHLQARTGYYAVPGDATDEQDSLNAALGPAFDASEIGIRGSKAPKSASSLRFTLHINAADVRIAQQGDRYTGHLGLQVAAYSADGSAERAPVNPMDLNWTADELAKARRDGIEWVQDLNLGDKVQRVRFLVFDRESHAIGTLTVPVK